MSDNETVELNEEDKALIRAYLVAIFKKQAENWTINSNVASVVETMLRESENCSDSMDFVPRPHGVTKVGLTYIRKQLTKIAKRTTKKNVFEIKKHYIACINIIKYNYRTPLAMARSGL